MALELGSNKSRFVAFVAIFTALVMVFDAIPIVPVLYSGVWDSWIFILSPLIGVLLGPFIGGITTLFGSLLGHFIYWRDPYELLFMLGAPLGSVISGLVFQQRWRPVLIIYSGLLVGYFLTPVTWLLPLWGIWDTLAGYCLVLLFSLFSACNWWIKVKNYGLIIKLFLCSVIGLEADILLRVFILVPGQTYWLFYGWTPAILQVIWLTAGFITPIKVTLAALMTIIIGYSIMRLLPRLGIISPAKT